MSAKIISILTKGFINLVAKMSANLGNQSSIGSTEMAGCPRQAALNRLNPPTRTLPEQIVMIMGHLIQDLIADLFTSAGYKGFKRNVELVHPEYDFIRVHVPLFAETASEVRIRDLKSTKRNPSFPYSTWNNKVQILTGLAALIHPGKTVTGSIMAVDRVNGDCKEFFGYSPNSFKTEYFVSKGKAIWAAINGTGPIPNPEPESLCGSCHHRSACPAHQMPAKEIPLEVQEAASDYYILQAHKAKLEKEIERRREEILAYTGESFQGEDGGLGIKVSVARNGYVRLDVTVKTKEESKQLELLAA